MKQIIVNADDFGINEVVTAEIEKMIEARAVSSTTVMANGACLDEVKRFAAEHPETSFGVHLCLSEFSSVTKSEVLRSIGVTDCNGDFINQAIFRVRGLNTAEVQKAIKDELNAQIDIVSSLGFPVSHADSHHHVHTIFSLRALFADVLQKRGVKKIRIGTEFQSIRMKAHICQWVKRNQLNSYYRKQFITVDKFCNYAEFVRNDCFGLTDERIELMCHPGHPGKQFQDEMKMVKEKQAFSKDDISLITYNDLQ